MRTYRITLNTITRIARFWRISGDRVYTYTPSSYARIMRLNLDLREFGTIHKELNRIEDTVD